MNWKQFTLLIGAYLAFVHCGSAITRYVNAANPTPSSPYTSWASAATSIQGAIDVAGAGDLILITNGIYQTGGRAIFGQMTNRVAITKALVVQSVNGPSLTTIRGAQSPVP